MTEGFITVIVDIASDRVDAVNAVLDQLGNPALPPQAHAQALDGAAFVHFMSMIAVPPPEGGNTARLVIEVCADGHPKAALERLAETIPDTLLQVLATARIPASRVTLARFLEKNRRGFSMGLFRKAGLAFAGTPGMSVRRIRDEWTLAKEIRRRLGKNNKYVVPGPALPKLQRMRARIFENPDLKWAFVSEPVPLLGDAKPFSDRLGPLMWAAFRDFLWPLMPLPLAVFAYSFYTLNAFKPAFWDAVLALIIEVVAAAIIVFIGYRILRYQEDTDVPLDKEPELARMQEILERENEPKVEQNHLAGVSILKPGLVRYVTLRLSLWLIGESGKRRSKPGHIDKIGTIHYARWLQLPGTNQLVFLSNYDGSWQSYLEDFIARLHAGLTSVWSNTRDFPKTRNLAVGGAADPARFKRWARRQQLPTRFWYSAYPQLTTDRIRTNAAIRHGFAGAANEVEAAKWLSLFGYQTPENVEKDEVCTLAFGGMPFFPFAHCLLVQFDDDVKAHDWLRTIQSDLSFGEHAVLDGKALVAAFTAEGLRKLGVAPTDLATFPIAFQQGMAGRARALGDGDTGGWTWGGRKWPVHAALILYGDKASRLAKRVRARRQTLEGLGHAVLEVPMKALEKNIVTGKFEAREPFGFRDGISQPIMRGSKHWTSPEKAMHVVEPGELVLGYRDNLGTISPSPRGLGEDIGRNGTFLVIRQLEQHKAVFEKYIAEKAKDLADDDRVQGLSGKDLEHWVAAKMVGRWNDGTSLVRNPHPPSGKGTLRPLDNDFRFGKEDPDGMRCPLGAHIRRANPRESFDPDSEVQLGITNRHRILRVGRSYGNDEGLLFMCINADIERQFEFLQQTWIHGSNFHKLDDEIDPIAGYRNDKHLMTVPTARGPVRLEGLKEFVTVLGGGYFFVPGKLATGVLAADPVPAAAAPIPAPKPPGVAS